MRGNAGGKAPVGAHSGRWRGRAMSYLDQASRYAARRLDAEGFLRWLLGEETWQAWCWTGWLDTQAIPLPGEPDRRADVVAAFERLAGDAPPMAVVVEFMSEARS